MSDILLESFDKLYDSGYRFLESLDDVKMIEERKHSTTTTSAKYINFTVDGLTLTEPEKVKMFNYAAFLLSVKNRKSIK